MHHASRRPYPGPRGFTLVELLVTIAVVGLLGTIAIPSYRNYILRGQLQEGIITLQALRVAMEQYNVDNHTYLSSLTAPVVSSPCDTAPLASLNARLKFFTVTCAINANGLTYTASATGKSTLYTNGFVYSITQANGQQTTIPTRRGWTAGTYSCFTVRAGGGC